jgi:hypothetical protein
VLALTLHANSYSWAFKPATGTFTDSGSATCHNAGPAPTPSPSASPSPKVTASPSPTAGATSSSGPSSNPNPTAPTGGGSTTFSPVADSYVDASTPTVTHGTLTTIRIDGSPVVRSYLRFNVTGITGGVASATLRVWANSAQSTGYSVYSVANNTWGETTITNDNAPPFGPTSFGSSGKITAGTWTSVDVTAAISGNGTYSFGISTTNSTAVSLSSREGPHPPQLVIVPR